MVFQGLKISGADVLVLHVGIQRLMDCRSLIVNTSALGASAFQLIQDGDRSQLRGFRSAKNLRTRRPAMLAGTSTFQGVLPLAG